MQHYLWAAITGACLAPLFMTSSHAAQQQAGGEGPPAHRTFISGTSAVVVDAVVRDRQGNPVTNLRAKDFELYEDGVRQKITSVSLVAPGPSARASDASEADGSTAPARPPPQSRSHVETPTVVALVFDRLSPEGRVLAHKSALAYLDTSHTDDFAGVFLIDQSLQTIETFTNDRQKLRAALDDVAVRATSSFDAAGAKVYTGSAGDTGLGVSMTAGAEEHGPPVGATPTNADPTMRLPAGMKSAPVEVRVRMLANRMERSYEAMMHEQQGHATATALLVIADALGRLPGRKTVVFFAESLLIPAAVEAAFDSVIVTANRGNVSVYTVDAAGLRAHSEGAQTATQINALGEVGVGDTPGMNLITGDQTRDRGTDRAWTKDLELNEDILRQDPSASLGMLANWTGGFLIDNTNDLESGFRRIDADRRFHYLLTYTPKNEDFKGEYRRISVEVPKRDVSVRARNGYLAVRTLSTVPLLAYEAPAIDALARTPLPAEIPVRGAAFSFPDPDDPGRLALLVEADSDALTFELDPERQTFRTDFTVLGRIRDSDGRVVRKASQPYRLSVPPAQAQTALKGGVLFFRQPTLPPGAYTLEFAVHDALGRKAGAGRSAFEVFDRPKGGLQVSSLVIVHRTEQVAPDDRAAESALHFGGTLHYPNLGTPLRRSEHPHLSCAVFVKDAAGTIQASLALRQGERELVRTPLVVPRPDASGRQQLVGDVPLADVPAGTYTLHVTVAANGHTEVREGRITVTE
jgi:VWFA-related protein